MVGADDARNRIWTVTASRCVTRRRLEMRLETLVLRSYPTAALLVTPFKYFPGIPWEFCNFFFFFTFAVFQRSAGLISWRMSDSEQRTNAHASGDIVAVGTDSSSRCDDALHIGHYFLSRYNRK